MCTFNKVHWIKKIYAFRNMISECTSCCVTFNCIQTYFYAIQLCKIKKNIHHKNISQSIENQSLAMKSPLLSVQSGLSNFYTVAYFHRSFISFVCAKIHVKKSTRNLEK